MVKSVISYNQTVDYYEDPGMPGLFRYEVNRYPYVEVAHGGEVFHAQAQAWAGGMVMIGKPTGQLQRVDNCAREVLWVPSAACHRIRRKDSIWITTQDDHDWHSNQDEMIDYSPQLKRD